MTRAPRRLALAAALCLGLAACAGAINPPIRMGMVKDPDTGLMFGSVVEKNFVTDPSFYKNRKLKVRIRNTSGDGAFDLEGFRQQIETAYAETGYEPTSGDDFGILVDVNVRYSGQAQSNLAEEFGFLGAATGGLAGAHRRDGDLVTATGAVAGATLGSLLGSFVTDDTYMIVTGVTVGVVGGPARREGKRITFSRSAGGATVDTEDASRRGLKSAHRTGVSVYAGGRNTPQSAIAGEVRARIVRIIRDII